MIESPRHIFQLMTAPEDVMREWFSGELPQVHMAYALKCIEVKSEEDGLVTAVMQYVPI